MRRSKSLPGANGTPEVVSGRGKRGEGVSPQVRLSEGFLQAAEFEPKLDAGKRICQTQEQRESISACGKDRMKRPEYCTLQELQVVESCRV